MHGLVVVVIGCSLGPRRSETLYLRTPLAIRDPTPLAGGTPLRMTSGTLFFSALKHTQGPRWRLLGQVRDTVYLSCMLMSEEPEK